MSCSDSKAVFKARFLELGLTEEQFRLFDAEALNTMGTFAFSCNFAPGGADEKPLVSLVTKILAGEPSTFEMSCLRRLFSEAYSTIAAEIKSQVEASDEMSAKRLAPAERAQRLKDQQQRLTGLELRGNYEPGDTLVDRCVAAYESDRIVYLAWETCVSREHELLTGSKKDSGVSFDSSGNLKLSKKETAEPCLTSSEMQVRYCLVRRGLALDQANIMTYAKHDRLTEKLLGARLDEPPHGYVRLTMKQVETADKKFWSLMAELTREGIKTKAAGKPCDLRFSECFNSLPQTPSQPKPARHNDGPKPKKSRSEPSAAKGSGKGFQELRMNCWCWDAWQATAKARDCVSMQT